MHSLSVNLLECLCSARLCASGTQAERVLRVHDPFCTTPAHKGSRNEHDVPVALLHVHLFQLLVVDNLLFEFVSPSGELALRRDGPSVLADFREPVGLKDLFQYVLSCSTRSTKNDS